MCPVAPGSRSVCPPVLIAHVQSSLCVFRAASLNAPAIAHQPFGLVRRRACTPMYELGALALLLGAGAALLVLCRGAVLWYWKVEERVHLAREQNALLRDVRDALRAITFEKKVERDSPVRHPAAAPTGTKRSSTAPV